MPAPPDYIYPGQAFDELGSLATVIPKYPAMALSISTLPGSRDAINTLARAVMQSDIPPYGD
jgi:hypothetical protein